MKTFAAWVLNRRHWLVILAIGSAQFLPPVACGLLIADGAKQGPARAAPVAAIVLLAVMALSLGNSVATSLSTVSGVVTVAAGFLLGALLAWSRSLELTFQVTVLTAMILVMSLAIVGPAPALLAAPLITQITTFMELLGGASEQIELVRNWDPVLLLGSMFAGVLAQVLAALILGCWAYGRVDESFAFARQFTSLRLGRIVGIVSIVVLTAGLALNWPSVQYLKSMAVVAFLYQGLAIMHAWLQAKGWHWGITAAIYASVITPLSGLVLTGLCAVGLVDNFFSLRRPLNTGAK